MKAGRFILSFLLAICMIVTLTPLNAMAVPGGDTDNAQGTIEQSADQNAEETADDQKTEGSEKTQEEKGTEKTDTDDQQQPAEDEETQAVPSEESAEPADDSSDEVVLSDQTLEKKLGTTVITVSGMMPEDADLQVVEVPGEAIEGIIEGETVFAVDISILYDGGKKYQPEDFDKKLKVSIDSLDAVDDDTTLKILHVKEDVTNDNGQLDKKAADSLAGNVRKGKVETETLKPVEQTEDGVVAFKAEEFSVYAIVVNYTVDFFFCDAKYSMDGGSEIYLSQLFGKLEIPTEVSEVDKVIFSNKRLVGVEQKDNNGKADWLLTSLEPFKSKQLLTVTLKDGTIIEIGVMDKFSGVSGTCGTCAWNIDENYVMTITPAEGTSGTLDSLSAAADAPWHDYRNKISKIVVEDGVKAGENAAYMFASCTNLTSVDLSGLDLSETTNIGYMFSGCSTLKSIDLSGLDTSNVQKMHYLFNGCSNLTSVDMSGLDLGSVNNFTYMFQSCAALETVDLKISGQTSSTAYMFNGCSSLKNLNVSDWDVSNISSMVYMFQNCSSLPTLDVSNWDTGNVTSMTYMFNGASVIDGLDLSNWNTAKVTNMSYMFQNCKGLTNIDISGRNLAKVTTMLYMFNGCTKLASADLSDLTLTLATDLRYLFNGCSKLTDVNLTNFNAPKVTGNCSYMFQNCSSLETIDLSTFSTPLATSYAYMFNGCTKLAQVKFGGESSKINSVKVANMSYMFQNCSSLATIDLVNLNTEAATNMSYMFNGCSSLTSLDLAAEGSLFKPAKLTNMNYMFQNCTGLEEFKLTLPNTGNSFQAQYMLSNCKALTDIDLRIDATGTGANLSYLFNGCSALEKIDLSHINTEKVTTMNTPLRNCLNISEVVLGGSFKFINTNTGLVDGYWDKVETTNEQEGLTTKQLVTASMNGETEGTYVLYNYEYTVILYEDGELVFTKGGEPEAGRTVVDTYALPNGATVPGWNEHAASITKVTFKDEIVPTTTYYWFYGCTNLTDENIVGLEKLDTKDVTYMTYMFTNCSKLKNMDVTGFDTSSLTSAAYMFSGCTGLENLKVTGEGSKFDTTNVLSMNAMFQNCSSLTELDLDGFKTDSATNLSYMFDGCSKLATLDLSSFNTANVTNMSYMFRNCSALEGITFSESFTGPKVTTTAYMFAGCTKLADLDMSDFATTGSLTRMEYMFQNCKALTAIDLSSFVTNNVTYMSYMFSGCSALTDVDVSSFNTAKAQYMQYMFNGCSSLETLDINHFRNNASNVNLSYMFNGCTKLKNLNIKDFAVKNATNASYMFQNCSSLEELKLTNLNNGTAAAGALTNVGYMFSGCSSLKKLDVATLNVLKATTYTAVLDCKNLEEITIGNNFKFSGSNTGIPYVYWDKVGTDENENIISSKLTTTGNIPGTYVYAGDAMYVILYDDGELVFQGTEEPEEGRTVSKTYSIPNGIVAPDWHADREEILKVTFKEDIKDVTPSSTYYWFQGCKNLETIDGIENLNTSKVTSMQQMFDGCNNLTTELDLSDWDTANVTNMYAMFCNCNSLTKLDVSDFVTAKVTNMQQMFDGCKGLTELTLGDLNTSNCTNMSYMFRNCSGLTALDVSGLDTQKVTTMAYMFYGCNQLPEITGLENFNTSRVTTIAFMFEGDEALESLESIKNWNVSNVTTMQETFASCHALEPFDLSNWNTGKVTSLYGTFAYCHNFEDASEWNIEDINTSKVTNWGYIFQGCGNLKTADITQWDTSAATSLAGMFSKCPELLSVDMSGLSTSKATAWQGLFRESQKLVDVNLTGVDTSAATNMSYMFHECYSIKKLDLSMFNTAKVANMGYMFSDMISLEELDIRNFDTTKTTTLKNFFGNDDVVSLQKISVGELTNFKYNEINGISFPRGFWKKIAPEDADNVGEEYSSGELSQMMVDKEAEGTYIKTQDHSLQAEFPVTYYIEPLKEIDDYVFTPGENGKYSVTQYWIDEDGNEQSKVIEYDDPNDLFVVSTWENGETSVYVKLDALEQVDITRIEVNGGISLLFKDKAIDAEGNTYDFQIKLDDIFYYDYLNGPEGAANSVEPKEEGYMYLMSFTKLGSRLTNYFASDTVGDEESLNYTSSAEQLTMTVLGKDGKPVDGSFLFSIYDLDIPSYRDFRDYSDLVGDDGEKMAKPSQENYRSYLYFSEGVYLKDGFDYDTITKGDFDLLYDLGIIEGDPFEGYRITGTRLDSRSELMEFLVKSDASGATFIWTAGGHAGTDFLSMYQPTAFDVEKQDNSGNKLAGAKLKLTKVKKYNGDAISPAEVIGTWESRSDVAKKLFLPPGYYDLEETEAPAGYYKADKVHAFIDYDYNVWILDGDSRTKVVDENGNAIHLIKMTDVPKKGDVKIIKKEAGSNKALDGAGFTLTGKSTALGDVNMTVITDENGEATFKDVPYGGPYNIEETTVPTGYAKAADRTVSITENDNGEIELQELTIYDDKTDVVGSLEILKKDKKSAEALKGAKFELSYMDSEGTTHKYSATTDENGKAKFDNLPVGEYTLKEATPPNNYEACDETWKMTVSKETNNPVGVVSVEVGEDSAAEFEAKDGESGKLYLFTLKDTEKILKLKKVDAATGKALSGAEFVVKDKDGKFLKVGANGSKSWIDSQDDATVFVSDANGYIEIPAAMPAGNYKLIETKAPENGAYNSDGYEYTIKIDESAALVVDAEFKGLSGKLSPYASGTKIGALSKYALGDGVRAYVVGLNGKPYAEGTEFTLYVNSSNTPITATLGAKGEIIFDAAHIPGYSGTSDLYALATDDCPWNIYVEKSGYTITGASSNDYISTNAGAVLTGYDASWLFTYTERTKIEEDGAVVYEVPNGFGYTVRPRAAGTEINIQKYERDGEETTPMQDVKFVLHNGASGDAEKTISATTDADGKAKINIPVAEGWLPASEEDQDEFEFTLTETTPEGHKAAGPWTVTVKTKQDENGTIVTYEIKVDEDGVSYWDRFIEWITDGTTPPEGFDKSNLTLTVYNEVDDYEFKVKKVFKGITEAELPTDDFAVDVKYTDSDGKSQTYKCTLANADPADTPADGNGTATDANAGLEYTWTIEGVKYGTDVTVEESGYDVKGYYAIPSVETNVSGAQTPEPTKATFTMPGNNDSVVTFTNNYIELGDLKVIKDLLSYETGSDASFEFRIVAKLNGEKVYEDVMMMTFNKACEQFDVLEGKIPVGAEVTVTEVYEGSDYKLNGAGEKKTTIIPRSQGTAEVSFANDYDGTITHGYGINNKYTNNNGTWEVEQQDDSSFSGNGERQ